jgi:hypothetical protein
MHKRRHLATVLRQHFVENLQVRDASQNGGPTQFSLSISRHNECRSRPDTQEIPMQLASDWWPRCAFVRDYFFGGQQKVAHQLAEYLARYYVGDEVTELRPDTDVSALVGDSIRRYINQEDFTMARDNDLFADVDLKESITFKELVKLVHLQRGSSD